MGWTVAWVGNMINGAIVEYNLYLYIFWNEFNSSTVVTMVDGVNIKCKYIFIFSELNYTLWTQQ